MPTGLFTHPACLRHDNGFGHPECPERLQGILAELSAPGYAVLRREAPVVTIDQIARVHDRAYAEHLLARVPVKGFMQLDPDTALSPHSGEAALCAAGAVVAAVDAVMAGEVRNAFCTVRPPGHHAEHAQAMGFCLFNNVAIGAAHALTAHRLARAAIVDFDVHHGNGTQEWAEGEPRALFCSTHQFPFYPGSGAAHETGAHGNIVNVPLPAGAGSAQFRIAMTESILPALETFKPEFIFISAGFDAHRDDPLAQLNLTEEDFGWITGELVVLAGRLCKGRIVSTLEGGYDLDALARCAGAHVKALMQAKNVNP